MNEKETIDGVRGEWRTVTRPEEVTVGQRVRFWSGNVKWGFTNTGDYPFAQTISHFEKGVAYLSEPKEVLFKKFWDGIQAFFPLPVIKRKVAKVLIEEHGPYFRFVLTIANFNPIFSCGMASHKSATKSAQRFCKAIGYECEIVK